MIYTVIIADDEPHARAYLRRLLLKDEEVDLVKECKNGSEVLSFIEKVKPDVLFLDIEMPGATGLEVASMISKDIAVIFTTAYQRYAIDAFDFEVLDYLLKPFDEEKFQRSLKRAKTHTRNNIQQEFTQKMLPIINDYKQKEDSELKVIELKKKGFLKKIYTRDIIYIEASSVYAELYTMKGKELYRSSLNDLEKILPEIFLRIHRSIIINMNKIERSIYNNDNTYDFYMKGGTKHTSGRTYKERIIDKF